MCSGEGVAVFLDPSVVDVVIFPEAVRNAGNRIKGRLHMARRLGNKAGRGRQTRVRPYGALTYIKLIRLHRLSQRPIDVLD